jgi:hypothetical protein
MEKRLLFNQGRSTTTPCPWARRVGFSMETITRKSTLIPTIAWLYCPHPTTDPMSQGMQTHPMRNHQVKLREHTILITSLIQPSVIHYKINTQEWSPCTSLPKKQAVSPEWGDKDSLEWRHHNWCTKFAQLWRQKVSIKTSALCMQGVMGKDFIKTTPLVVASCNAIIYKITLGFSIENKFYAAHQYISRKMHKCLLKLAK